MLIQSLPIENDLDQIYFEARCIANALKQDQNTAHALLAIMTCSNPARILLESFNINKDALIQVIKYSAPESNNILLKSKAYAEQSALRFSAKKTNSIHLLHALLKTVWLPKRYSP